MSLDNQQKQQGLQQQQQQNPLQRRELDFLDNGENNLVKFHDFDNIDLRMEDVNHDNFEEDGLQGFKMGANNNNFRNLQNSGGVHSEFLASGGKYSDFYHSNVANQNGVNEGNHLAFSFNSGYENTSKSNKNGNSNGTNKNQNKSQGQGGQFQYPNQMQNDQIGFQLQGSNQQILQGGKQKGGMSSADQEQQKQIKLINALKSKPQDLEQILEEQEKQSQIQKKLKIECDAKNNNISKNSSSIQLTSYSPTRETIKKVESNGSLNGGDKPSQKNLSKIKGNVKNAYIKKITSLLNLQNQQQNDNQENNQQEPRRNENSEDSDISSQKSYDNTKQEDGKKVIKNRESARNSRQRKKIYIELLEKKINELQSQIEEQCVNIEKSQKEICKILDNHNHIKAFVQTRHDYLQKIGDMANAEKPNTEQLTYILDSLRLRIGAQGTCRQKAMSLYFKTMMKYFMQSTVPYLIYGYQQNISGKQFVQLSNLVDFFHLEDQEFNRCVEIFKKICNIQDEAQVFKFLPCLKKFLEVRENFKGCYRQMKKIRKSSFKRQESIERLLDGLSLLHPTQMGKFLKGLDKFRKYKEIRLQAKSIADFPEQFEIEQNNFKKTIPPQEKQIQKLRQYTVHNQFLGNQTNGFPQIHPSIYPQQISHTPQIEIEDHHMDLGAQSKQQVGFNSNFYYQKSLQANQQNALNFRKDPNGYQKYLQSTQGQNIGTSLNTKPPELDQYYHQQSFKIPPYSDHPSNNIPF